MSLQSLVTALMTQAAPNLWRGLLLLQPESPEDAKAIFHWPQHCLVLSNTTGVPLKQYRNYLGTSQPIVVLDFRDEIHADALAALAGAVPAGGVLLVLLPAVSNAFSSRLTQYLRGPLQRCHQYKACDDLTVNITSPVPLSKAPYIQPDSEQENALKAINEHLVSHPRQPVLINAARGRGKSTVLGLLANDLLNKGLKVWLCAPSKAQVATVFSTSQYPDELNFIAPDALLQAKLEPQDILLLDEAASLPRHRLDEIVTSHPSVVMATTSEGYESCGRGFLLQFTRDLHQRYNHFCELNLYIPKRFASHCPLERWILQCLLLQPIQPLDSHSSLVYEDAELEYQITHASRLSESLLEQCFYLLMDAHYQTSPNDLKLLLNDPQQTLYLQKRKEQVTGVAWLAEEGSLDSSLAEAVVDGVRRPPGNLLAQTLARHFIDPELAIRQWVRIVRIAIQPDLQQQGLGSQLLAHITNTIRKQNYFAIGTSFASAPPINRFWYSSKFRPVRIGTKRDTVSGRYALIMLYPLAPSCEKLLAHWQAYFALEQPAYKTLLSASTDFMLSMGEVPRPTKQDIQQYQLLALARIKAFCTQRLDFDSCKVSLQTLQPELCKTNPLLRAALSGAPLGDSFKQQFNLHGRKDLLKAVREICLKLIVKI